MRIPIGPLLNFEDGLNPRTGSAFSARLSSTSPKDFMFRCQLFDYFNESGEILCTQRFACTHGVPMYTPVNTTVPTNRTEYNLLNAQPLLSTKYEASRGIIL